MSLDLFKNRHGVQVFPALRTQSELRRGRRHEPVVRYSQNPQGQWVRGFENLRTMVAESELNVPLATAPAAEPHGKIYRDSDGTVRRERAPMVSRKMTLNAQGDWERAAA